MGTNPNPNSLVIIDARPKANAMGNQVLGKGFESEEFYNVRKVMFMGMENIHVIRDSFMKMRELVNGKKDSTRLSSLEATGWMKHLQTILKSACQIAELVDHDAVSVLIHCSDGWDRTPQLSSLSSILLDPKYRSIEGFWKLLEKEWILAGHNFTTRCGHSLKRGSAINDQFSPIFLQFLDGVYQIVRQFPTAFEFREEFLILILDAVYSCRYGQFLFSCEKELVAATAHSHTASFWKAIHNNIASFVNAGYTGNRKSTEHSFFVATNEYAFVATVGNVLVAMDRLKQQTIHSERFFL
eukprot:c8235_g1_i1.p1 GENE.c8235_g1_i1~~c8235_g1_i1.p1  ORF type:complete len:298 (+),score=69.56 c8235_g1_i1:391-1284(+)